MTKSAGSTIHISFRDTQIELVSGRRLYFNGQLTFTRGEIALVVGENASGKTTLLSIIQSIADDEERGSIQSINWSEIETNMTGLKSCQVFQEPRENFICRTSADEIILPLLDSRYTAKEIMDKISDLCDAADIYETNFWGRPIDHLSSGEQQKVAICAALAPQPDIMLWDEALARIDDKSADRLGILVKEVGGAGVLIAATHRPKRYMERLGAGITSIVALRRHGEDRIEVEQFPSAPSSCSRWDAEFEDVNFAARSLWTTFVKPPNSAKRLFSNGFRCFPGRTKPIFCVERLSFRYEMLEIARLREGEISEGINFIVGRNGSGKTLFLKLLAGKVALNPLRTKQLHAVSYVPVNEMGDLKRLRAGGLSVYLSGEPMRWITEDTVRDEIRMFHDDDEEFLRRELLLRVIGVDMSQNPAFLSYGQKKLVCLLSLPSNLQFVALDEPFADLSVEYIEEVERFIEYQIRNTLWRVVALSHSSDVTC